MGSTGRINFNFSGTQVRSLDLFTAAAHIGVMSSSEYRFPKALVKAILMQARLLFFTYYKVYDLWRSTMIGRVDGGGPRTVNRKS